MKLATKNFRKKLKKLEKHAALKKVNKKTRTVNNKLTVYYRNTVNLKPYVRFGM